MRVIILVEVVDIEFLSCRFIGVFGFIDLSFSFFELFFLRMLWKSKLYRR